MKIMKKLFYILIVIITIFPLFLLEIKVDANELDSSQSIYPNDPLLDEQWGLRAIRAIEGWKYEHDASNIRVAIIDSGVNFYHSDLRDNFNGSLSKSFSDKDVTHEPNGHGSEVAGIIGAKGNNKIGIAGICWDVEMVALKVSDTGYAISPDLVTKAVNYAKNIGANVINMSFGQIGKNNELSNAIKSFNGLVVCSAGNDGLDNDKNDHYPSNYDLDNIIVVGAMDKYYEPCLCSNYGKTTVDIFAPAPSYTTKYNTNDYGYSLEKTSFAAPYVTGAAALLMAYHPDYSPAMIKNTILERAKKINSLKDKCVSGGYLDLADMFHIHEYMYEYYNKKQHRRYCLNCEDFYEDHNWTRVMEYPMQSIPNLFDPNVRMIYECVGCGTRSYGPVLGDII